ncbi:MAG: LTA synthase family protein [Lachnospiraceae bacterium]|nr:LTA synthase family protein [Lachnospiraceae bacterium]
MDFLYLPLTYFYYELLFNRSTIRTMAARPFFTIMFFAFFYGMIAVLVSFWPKNKKVKNVLQGIMIFLPVIPCLVEYFVFRQFKIFYDWNTVTKGAGDAAGGFQADIKRMVFSASGLGYIFLFFLPLLAFIGIRLLQYRKVKLEENARAARAERAARTGRTTRRKAGSVREISDRNDRRPRYVQTRNSGKRGFNLDKVKLWVKFVAVGALILFFYLLAIIMVKTGKITAKFYDKEYNFEYAIQNFGFVTGLRKEISRGITGKADEIGFESTDDITMPPLPSSAPVVTSAPVNPVDPSVTDEPLPPDTTPTQAPTPTPIVYGESKLDIDFEALVKKDSGTYKELDNYCASLTPSKQNAFTGLFKGKNLIFISAEAFSAEVIDKDLTPTLYRLATKGFNFTDYYQFAGAGTTGGEYQNLFGMLPTMGGQSFKQTATYNNYFLISAQLNRLGYYGKAYHNNDYTYYSRNKTHINLGFSDGYIGYGSGVENYVKKQWPESDDEMFIGSMPDYIDKQPFSIYYMSVSGHGTYGWNVNSMSRKHKDRVQHLNYSEGVQAYIAANLDLEDGLTHMVAELEAKGIADDTVIVISADHFPYGLDAEGRLGDMPLLSELYGYEVKTSFQRDHNRLIIWSGCLEKSEPVVISSPTSSLDILPTLCNLFGVDWDSRLHPGRDVFSDAMALAFTSGGEWKTDYGTFYAGSGRFEPKDASIEIPDGYTKAVSAIVKNKINFCKGVLASDYWGHLVKVGAVK